MKVINKNMELISSGIYKIKDELYGEYSVEKIIYEIINTETFKRLKNIHQGGGAFLVKKEWNLKRYEHSIGVMLLALKFGSSLEEQIKALLHDISHSAFSHVIDYVLGNEDENWHDMIQDKFLEKNDLIEIFERYGLDVKGIMSTYYETLDADLPDLSYDRLDYTLRDMYNEKTINKKEIDEFLKHLVICDDKLCIDSIEMGKWFSELYHKEVTEYISAPLNKYANTIFTKLLKKALKEDIIKLSDFELTDDVMMEKINNSYMKKELENIKNRKDFKEFILSVDKIKSKKRFINPYIVTDGKLRRLNRE